MRSAYCVEPFWLATTLPVKTASPSFCRFSSWSASTVTGPLRPSGLAPGAVGAGAAAAGRAGRDRAGAAWAHPPVARVAGDRPRARAGGALGRLVHLDRHLLHRRRVPLLEGLGVFRVELPSGAVPICFLKAHLLEPVVRGRGGGLGGNRPRRPGPMNEHTHHHR